MKSAAAILAVIAFVAAHPSRADSSQTFGDYIVRYNAIGTNDLLPAMARQYGIERSSRRGLLNISVESDIATSHTVNADITADVGDLTGHATHVAMRETSENGDIDYLGEFALDGSGTYLFTVKVAVPGKAQPFVVRFTHDFVVD